TGVNGLLARLGGDEFTVLLEDVQSSDEVASRAAQIVATLQEPLIIDGRVLTTSASVGASLYPDHAEDAEGLLRAADVALFRAKELGRNRFALYSPALYAAAAQRFRLEQSLRRAVEAGDLLLMYQPQVALHTFESTGVEALLRWRKSDGRIASAAEFIHVAEKTGLIHELTDWILHTAAATAAAWRAAGWHRASVAINVSAPQFFESDFVAHVARTLQVTGLPASALELEITYTVFQTGPATVDSLRQLRDLGRAAAPGRARPGAGPRGGGFGGVRRARGAPARGPTAAPPRWARRRQAPDLRARPFAPTRQHGRTRLARLPACC